MFENKDAKRIFAAALILLLVMCVPGFITGQAQQDKEKLQKTKQQLEEEIRYTTELLEKTQQGKQTSLNKIKVLNKQIKSREALINAINRELNDVQVAIGVEDVQIGQMTRQLDELKREYARMIYQAYHRMHGYSKLMFIFSARDFNQGYQRLKYYQQYAAYRRRQVERIESTQLAINGKKRELEEIKNQKLTLIEKQEAERQKLNREKDQKAKAVKAFSTKEKQLVATLKTKQQAARRLEAEISKLIAEEIRASEERAQKAGKGGKGSSTGGTSKGSAMALTPREQQLSSSFASNRGRLPWPCERGFISGQFGEHKHPVLEYVKVKNNGVDIMTEKGALVKAVFSGKVSRVMSFANLNKVVIIRHGDYLTVYSNLSEVMVRDGQEISAKQSIGRVFTNPGEQKGELHFEIWRGKVIQNPEDWLAGR